MMYDDVRCMSPLQEPSLGNIVTPPLGKSDTGHLIENPEHLSMPIWFSDNLTVGIVLI